MKIVNTLIVIVALLVLGLIGYSFYTNSGGSDELEPSATVTASPTATVSPTATTTAVKTYTNAQFKLSLKYPATYEQVAAIGTTTPLVLKTMKKSSFGTEDHRLSMTVISNKAVAEDSVELKNLLMANTVFDASGLNPESFTQFTKRTLGKNTFYFIPVGRFEGVLQFAYYLRTPNGVVRFDSVSYGVDWTNPELDTEADSGHMAARSILSTVEISQ